MYLHNHDYTQMIDMGFILRRLRIVLPLLISSNIISRTNISEYIEWSGGFGINARIIQSWESMNLKGDTFNIEVEVI